MNRLRELVAWLMRAWPLLAVAPLALAHAIAHAAFSGHPQLVNKVAGMLLQMLGGLLILYAINDNLGLFRSQSLLGSIRAWLQSFPFIRRNVVITGSSVAVLGITGSAAGTVSQKFATLKERVAYLEREIHLVRRELQAGLADAKRQLEQAKSELQARIDVAVRQVAELREKVERATVGGFKLQGYGVLLALYGAVTSVFA